MHRPLLVVRAKFSSSRKADHEHVHDHVNVHVDEHVLVDVIGFFSRPGIK